MVGGLIVGKYGGLQWVTRVGVFELGSYLDTVYSQCAHTGGSAEVWGSLYTRKRHSLLIVYP